jgi:hypothetical protein
VQQLRPGLVRAPVADENLARHKAPPCHGVPQLGSASAIRVNRATTARGLADVIYVGNNRPTGSPGMSALGRALQADELPMLAACCRLGLYFRS